MAEDSIILEEQNQFAGRRELGITKWDPNGMPSTTVLLEDIKKVSPIIRKSFFLGDPESFRESKQEVTVKFI